MVTKSQELRRMLPALTASIPIVIVFFAVLGIVLTAAGSEGLALSDERTSGWITVVYGLPMIPSLVLTIPAPASDRSATGPCTSPSRRAC